MHIYVLELNITWHFYRGLFYQFMFEHFYVFEDEPKSISFRWGVFQLASWCSLINFPTKYYFGIVSNMKYMKQESFSSWLFAPNKISFQNCLVFLCFIKVQKMVRFFPSGKGRFFQLASWCSCWNQHKR